MKLFKIIILSVILALIVFFSYIWIAGRKTVMSPIPEEGIKVIEVSPKK